MLDGAPESNRQKSAGPADLTVQEPKHYIEDMYFGPDGKCTSTPPDNLHTNYSSSSLFSEPLFPAKSWEEQHPLSTVAQRQLQDLTDDTRYVMDLSKQSGFFKQNRPFFLDASVDEVAVPGKVADKSADKAAAEKAKSESAGNDKGNKENKAEAKDTKGANAKVEVPLMEEAHLDFASLDRIRYLQKRNGIVFQDDVVPTLRNAWYEHDHYKEAIEKKDEFLSGLYLKNAREGISDVLTRCVPSRPIETRAIWTDRKSIVDYIRDDSGMRRYMHLLSTYGINETYFEVNNSSFAFYKSKILPMNPEIAQRGNWDPLASAIAAGEAEGVKVKAWFRVSQAGNVKHNKIVGKPADWPGPVLEKHPDWALRTTSGGLVPPRQDDMFFNLANPEVRKHVLSLVREVVHNYPKLAGLQVDNIRSHFSNHKEQVGNDESGARLYRSQTGKNIGADMTAQEETEFNEWKAKNIDSLVHDIRLAARSEHKDILVSAAVFPMPLKERMSSIQQHWENWLENGDVQTLEIMTYVNDPRDLNAKIAKVCDTVKNRALVFPGLIANRTDTAGFLQQGLTTWKSGTMGSVIFSSSILNLPQLEGLKHGPYRQPAFMTAEDKPVSAAQFIYKDFQRAAHTDWSDRVTDYHSHNLGIPAAGNPALSRIDSIAVELSHISDQSSKEELKAVAEEMAKLADNMRALPDSPYLKAHGKRAEYIINLLDQANMELGYAAYQAQFKDDNAQPLQVVDMPSSEQEKK